MHSFFCCFVGVAILGSCNWMEFVGLFFVLYAASIDVCLYSTNATNIDMNLTAC